MRTLALSVAAPRLASGEGDLEARWAAVARPLRGARAHSLNALAALFASLRAVAVGDALLGRTAGTACAVDFSPWIVESESRGGHMQLHTTRNTGDGVRS